MAIDITDPGYASRPMDESSFRRERPAKVPAPQWQRLLWNGLAPLASLKLTVTLLSLTVILVFVGTLAQWRKDTNAAVGQYFRTPVAWIEIGDLVPEAFFPEASKSVEEWEKQVNPGWQERIGRNFAIPFPGGMTLGILMALNLLCAHGIKFKIHAKGARFFAGLALILLGVGLTWLVVTTHAESYESQTADNRYDSLWIGIKIALAALWALAAYGLYSSEKNQRWQQVAITLGGLASFAFFLWLLYIGKPPVDDNSSRILWQLIKGGLAAGVLLAGCLFWFQKRAGVVLLHSGIMLMLVNELIVYSLHTEWKMDIQEGGLNWVAYNLNRVELVFTRPAPDAADEYEVISVPKQRLIDAQRSGARIKSVELPCDVEVQKFFVNSKLKPAPPGSNAKTALTLIDGGPNERYISEETPPVTGTAGAVDNPGALVKFYKKGTDELLGETWLNGLAGQELRFKYEDIGYRPPYGFQQPTIKADGGEYQVALRFARDYKPYALAVSEVRGENYLGSDTPRNYSSDVALFDSAGKPLREKHIMMNDPLRQAGETFYQANYVRDPFNNEEATSLQIVANTAWMLPYVACMIVATGLLYHFGVALARYLNRSFKSDFLVLNQDKLPVAVKVEKRIGKHVVVPLAELSGNSRHWTWIAIATTLTILLGYTAWSMRVPQAADTEMDLRAFGRLPVIFKGRMKSLDALARNSLNVISRNETFVESKDLPKRSAIQWLLDVYFRPEKAAEYKVIYIENHELVKELGLDWREKHLYSTNEVIENWGKLKKVFEGARGKTSKQLNTMERKAKELSIRLEVLQILRQSVMPIETISPELLRGRVPDSLLNESAMLFTFAELQHLALDAPQLIPYSLSHEFGGSIETIAQNLRQTAFALRNQKIAEGLKAPSELFSQEMYPFSVALEFETMRRNFTPQDKFAPNSFLLGFNAIKQAYLNDKPGEFRERIADYRKLLEGYRFENVAYQPELLAREAWFNHWNPFSQLQAFYIFGGVLALVCWLFPDPRVYRVMQPTVLAFLVAVFLLHAFALGYRMYLSGRPPVTNLYSSALFIGFGGVALMLIFEAFTRLSIGNVVAAFMGFMTLQIAGGLYGDLSSWAETGGDTMGVMRAVLDTNFWLATHVVTVTLGYATTFVAGALGASYLLTGIFTPSLSPDRSKALTRMIYGVVCFSIFFSFVGTVLGGLWADDSWGRFWGWDPKENGAFLIVLWNAIVLHARWGGMVKDRGLAALAIFGGVVTAWSYFGTNELGVGLHSYGFTEGVLKKLLIFAGTQLLIMALVFVPRDWWWSEPAAQGAERIS